MKKIVLLKNEKNNVIKNISIDYLFETSISRIDHIKLIKNNNDIKFLVNHYDDNSDLHIISLDYNINETINNENATDLYNYNEINDTLSLKSYISDNTITFTDMLYIDNHKYMLGRYQQDTTINIDGQDLDMESGFTSILCKSDLNEDLLWNRKIKHSTESDITTGPIINTMTKDNENNLYLFGLLTNRLGTTNVTNLEIDEIINPIINKLSTQTISIITKTNDIKVIWRRLIYGTNDSLLLNHKIEYSNDSVIISFNFSDSITIGNQTFTTQSKQIINTIIAKLDLNGNYIWIKHIKSNKYISIIDYTVDNDYIYCLGNFKGEANFDNIDLFYSGLESGYIIKMRINDGLILNNINIYSDDILKLNSITNDNKNIFISGAWTGNIYFNGKIKNSLYSDFFITNIKKNEF